MATDGELAARLRELELLHSSLRAITSTLELGELVRSVLESIKSVTRPEGLSLLLYDPPRDELVFAASETLSEETLAGRPPTLLREPGLETERLAVTLRCDDQVLGLLELRERWDGRPFDAEDLRRATELACELARTIEPGTLARDGDALHQVFTRVAAVVPSRATTLVLHDDQDRDLVFTSSRALRPGVVDGVRFSTSHGIAGWVARHRQTVCIDDVQVDPRHDTTLARRTGLVARNMICVPLVHRDSLVGVLQVINKVGAPGFTADEVRLVETLGAQATIAIAHAQLYHQVELASLTDDLTGLGNTRRFNAVFPATIAHGGPVSLLVLDLDELKGVVDGYGHAVGSRAIATVGRLITECTRPGDIAVRFGGDEFVVLLPDTSSATAAEVAESIRVAVEACERPDGADADIRVLTASIGVATFPDHAADAAALFRAADQAMYQGKFGGKNRVTVSGHEETSLESAARDYRRKSARSATTARPTTSSLPPKK
jgi:diguanylate cyclase (GGDEF)-like protein